MSTRGKSNATSFTNRRGDCVDFSRFRHGSDLGSQFVLGWFRFFALHATSSLPRVHNLSSNEFGWTFDDAGCRIELLRTTSQVSLKGGSFIPRPLVITAFDAATNQVDQAEIPGNAGLREVTLRGKDISSLTATNNGFENLISIICVGEVDIGRVFDDYLRSETQRDQAIRDHLNNPAAPAILDQALADLRALYDGTETPTDPDDDGSGDDDGFSFEWPPDWNCVFKNVMLMVAVTVALVLLAEALGVGTIGGLAETDVIVALTGTFGFPAETAVTIWQGLLVVGAAGMALSNCGVFG